MIRSHLLRAILPAPLREPVLSCIGNFRHARDWRAYQHSVSIPPPHVVKQRRVLEYARRHRLRIFIETGTHLGEMVRRSQHAFQEVYTIELDHSLADRASRRLARYPHVRVLEGDSADLLPGLLAGLREPALFWLDGHYSGGLTGRGPTDTPLMRELEAIRQCGIHGHVILIDDARCLGTGDYPATIEVKRALLRIDPLYRVEVAEDIVRCEPFLPTE